MTHTLAFALARGSHITNCLGTSTIAVLGLGADNLFRARNYLRDRAATAQTPKISQYSTN